ncbi:MAG: amidohydrolase [Chlorobi bacterium]|nr:amidohydrolase [Chlorobiota bacterium]
MKTSFIILLLLSMISNLGFTQKDHVDLICYNGTVYTVDNNFSITESFAVKNGKFVETGTNKDILSKYDSENIIDLKNKYVYPGFIDAHCHFYGYAKSLQWINLKGTGSFDEIINLLTEYHQTHPYSWVLGRGWDQNDWEIKTFPVNDKLNKLFPKTPVVLTRIDGHAVLVNEAALKIAGITNQTQIKGGEVIVKDNKPTGILIDNATDLIQLKITIPSEMKMDELLLQAQKNCFAVGLTTVSDAGLNGLEIEQIDALQKAGKLTMRIYAMLSPTPENIKHFVETGLYKNNFLDIRSIKLYADGALGSRGAKLIEPYSDDPGNSGLLLTPKETIDSICNIAYQNNYQVNTHAIGDSAVREILDIYAKYLKGKNDLRWRIEHSQIVSPDDINKYGKYNIIPSVQTTHATSDMYWADERLGPERIKTAYAYKDLLTQNGWIPNGSDFPVEDINPLLGFYAAFIRKDIKGYPENGFQIENALTRKQALKAMTIWAAKADFEENEKGSIEPGKFADFVIMNEDLMNIKPGKIPEIKIQATYLNGEKVFEDK